MGSVSYLLYLVARGYGNDTSARVKLHALARDHSLQLPPQLLHTTYCLQLQIPLSEYVEKHMFRDNVHLKTARSPGKEQFIKKAS